MILSCVGSSSVCIPLMKWVLNHLAVGEFQEFCLLLREKNNKYFLSDGQVDSGYGCKGPLSLLVSLTGQESRLVSVKTKPFVRYWLPQWNTQFGLLVNQDFSSLGPCCATNQKRECQNSVAAHIRHLDTTTNGWGGDYSSSSFWSGFEQGTFPLLCLLHRHSEGL